MRVLHRILHVGTDPEWRGGENQIQKLCRGLGTRDVESFIAYPHDSKALPRFAAEFKTLALPGDSAASAIADFVEKNKIHIINAHSSTAHKLALSALKSTSVRPQLVVHRRVLDFPTFNPFRRAKYFDPAVARIVAVSKNIADRLRANKIAPEKIAMIHDGIALSDFALPERTRVRAEWRRKLEIGENTLALGVIAALGKGKGHEDFLQALVQIDQAVDWCAVIAGRGPREEELRAMTAKLGLGSRVRFLGFVENVPELLSALDVVALPSHSEGLGSSLIEASLAGCAVIGSNIGGIPEFVRDGATGLLFRCGDSRALAGAIVALQSSERRAELQSAALKLAKDEFSVEKMCEKTFAVYQATLKSTN